jgi:flagellar basal-body rod modification protein FlgD
MADALATVLNPVASATGTSPSTTSGVTPSAASDATTIAKNFETFLTLLTTQLKNQNPLEPLDTNQFTQQLVQFTQVEQQMKMNSQLASLISIEQTAQSTAAMAYLGATATVDGSTAKLESGKAEWVFASDKPSTATINIKNSAGSLVYSGSFAVNAGQQSFVWDGRGNNGTQHPAGNYTLTVSAKDASGNNVAIGTEVSGTVDAVDLTKSPPVLTIGGQTFTVDKIKRVVRPGA